MSEASTFNSTNTATRHHTHFFFYIILITIFVVPAFFVGKSLFFGESRTIALAEPYTLKMIIDVGLWHGKPWEITYIDEKTKLMKTLKVEYDQDNLYVRSKWEEFLQYQSHLFYDLSPGSQSYADIYPEKYIPGCIFARNYEYNRMEIHKPILSP